MSSRPFSMLPNTGSSRRHGVFALTAALSIAVQCSLSTLPARAADPVPNESVPARRNVSPTPEALEASFSDRFFIGDRLINPGTPSTLKVVTLSTLYGASLVSLAAAAGFGMSSLDAKNDADRVRDRLPAGFCEDVASPDCRAYSRLRREQNSASITALGLLGGGLFFSVTAGALAHVWPNERPVSTTSFRLVPVLLPAGGALSLSLEL